MCCAVLCVSVCVLDCIDFTHPRALPCSFSSLIGGFSYSLFFSYHWVFRLLMLGGFRLRLDFRFGLNNSIYWIYLKFRGREESINLTQSVQIEGGWVVAGKSIETTLGKIWVMSSSIDWSLSPPIHPTWRDCMFTHFYKEYAFSYHSFIYRHTYHVHYYFPFKFIVCHGEDGCRRRHQNGWWFRRNGEGNNDDWISRFLCVGVNIFCFEFFAIHRKLMSLMN